MTAEIQIEPVASALGATITGLDLSGAVSNSTVAALRDALHAHQVIFIRDQDLDAPGLVKVARLLGQPNIYPFVEGFKDTPEVVEILKEPDDERNFGGGWHSDSTYLDDSPAYTMLYAKELPPIGGDTMYANTYLAYDGLSEGMQQMLSPLSAIYSAALSRSGGRASRVKVNTAMKAQNMADADSIQALHPVTPVHPETGRRSLNVSRGHTVCFDGMNPDESRPLIDFLATHSVRPEFTARMKWEVGTLGIWDNRCTQHFAIDDYAGHRRRMWRTTVCVDAGN